MQCSTILGFHATWKSSYKKIAESQFILKPEAEKWDWLGSGAYFWIENEGMADLWAKKISSGDPDRARSDKLVVITCEIVLGKCLNLANEDDMKPISRYFEKLKDIRTRFSQENIKPHSTHALKNENILRYLDHELIDSYIDYIGNDVDTVLGVFNNGETIFEGAEIRRYNSIQLVVRERALAGNIRIKSVREL